MPAGSPMMDRATQTPALTTTEPVSTAALASQPHVVCQLKNHTITVLCVVLVSIWVFSSVTSPTYEARVLRGMSVALALFLVFAAVHFPDGVLVRPHPAFWRVIKGISVLYLCLDIFLLFQNVADVRRWLAALDPRLGQPLPEQSYAEDCRIFAWDHPDSIFINVLDKLDVFVLAHLFGWIVKAIALRNAWLLWASSVLFEWMEITFRHILPNFRECWWDHLLLDVFGCNWLGIYLGMRLVKWFEMKDYDWKNHWGHNADAQGTPQHSQRKRRRSSFAVERNFSMVFLPASWTEYAWPPLLSSFEAYVCILGLIFAGTFIDLNLFFLKAQLWLKPSHWILLIRTAFFAFAATAGVRDIYEFATQPSGKMGMQGWLDLAIVLSELMLALRYWNVLDSSQPMPMYIKIVWIMFGICTTCVGVWLFCCRRHTTLKSAASAGALDIPTKSTVSCQDNDVSEALPSPPPLSFLRHRRYSRSTKLAQNTMLS